MTAQNNNNNSGGAERPVLRNPETREELNGSKPAAQRPTIKAEKRNSMAAGNANASSSNRPALTRQSEKAPESGTSTSPAASAEATAAGVSDSDFATIRGFIDSLGDPQVASDIDAKTEEPAQQASPQSPSPNTADDASQEQQPAASTNEPQASVAPTAGTDRDRSGLEQDLASIRLEDTDYRRIGHRNSDDKPLSTIIKGGIAL